VSVAAAPVPAVGCRRARILVLGAGGFLGSQFRGLLDHYRSSVTMVCVSRKTPTWIESSDEDSRWINLDLSTASDADVIGRLVRSVAPDAIVNCAGAVAGTPEQLKSANIDLVMGLLAALAGTGTRLVQLGSAAEYGPPKSHAPVAEDVPCSPVTDYGRTKMVATDAVREASRSGQVDGIVLRVFNPVGAGIGEQTLPGRAARLIGEAIESSSGRIELGPLGAWRDYLDARDVAEAAIAAATRPVEAGLVLNVGSGKAVESRDLIHRLARVAAFDGTVGEAAEASGRSAGVSWQQADVHAIADALGWSTRYTLDDAVQDLWNGSAGRCP
jgi:nucleoside-diphosphate-sugar epimerase